MGPIKLDTLFLDRDGVINKKLERRYVRTWEEFEFIQNALLAIKLLSKKFRRILIITNQQGIGKGIMSAEDLEILHQKMRLEIEKAEGKIDKIYHCPHLAEENCFCRKPQIGMIKQAKKDFPSIEIKNSYLLGDSPSDIQAGVAAGLIAKKVDNVFTLYDWSQQIMTY